MNHLSLTLILGVTNMQEKQMVKKLSLFSEPSGSLPEEGNDSVYRRGYSVLTSCAESVSTACPVCACFRCVKHLKIPGATISRCDRGHWTGGTGYQFLYLERRERRNKYGKKNNPV